MCSFSSAVGRSSRAVFLLGLISILVFAGCSGSAPVSEPEIPTPVILPDESSGVSIPNPDIDLAAPLVISERAEDVALCARINETIDKSPFSNARWGVFAVSLKDGRQNRGPPAERLKAI
jgi:hypothetical protein